MSEKTRLHLPSHGKQLLAELVEQEQDLSIHCEDGVVWSCSLVLACLSPLLRGYLQQAEEPAIILPGVQVAPLQHFLHCLATEGSIEEHREILRILSASTGGCTRAGVKNEKDVEDEDGSELLITAQNLPLLSPLSWRRVTLELAGGESDKRGGRVDPPRSLARFVTVLDSDTDGFNRCFQASADLKAQVAMYIGQTEAGYVCKLALCSYHNKKRVLMMYHVLAHLKVNPFKRPVREDQGYLEFIQWKYSKKPPENIEEKMEKVVGSLAESAPEVVPVVSTVQKSELEHGLEEHADLLDDLMEPDDGLDPPETKSEAEEEDEAEEDEAEEDEAVEAEHILPDKEPPAEVIGAVVCNARAGIKKKLRLKKRIRRDKREQLESTKGLSRKKYKADDMSEETKLKCDQYITFAQHTREYKCTYTDCSYSHRSKTWLKYHVMKHLDISEFLCEECGEPFALQKLLRKHVMSVHGSDELRAAVEKWIEEDVSNPSWYRCRHPQCGFAAATKKGAGLHALSEHMEKSFICDLCGEGFVTERSLQNHSNYHHNKGRLTSKLYPCTYCQKSFRTASYLDAHENEHKGVRPYQCDACGKSFASNGMLRSHKFAHAPKIFKCDCCDQAFPRKNTLMVHLRAVHMHEKPYECDICGQKFPRSSSMTRHRRIHTGLPRYQCHYCDKTTTQRGDLNRHMAKVHGWPSRDYRQPAVVVHAQVQSIVQNL